MNKFNELINSGQPILVDFSAEWCGPCKALAPVLKSVAEQTSGKAKIIKVDIDKNPAVATQYGVKSVPTLLLFKNGKLEWRQSGLIPLQELLNTVLKFI